tara:strand:- start:5805 stop:6518 length:714 start_codon:yes stop_codon:yes gene_type:complete
MNDKIVPYESGNCSCCLSENTSILFCPIDKCNYVLCYECIDKIKQNNDFNGKCPACRNININLIASKIPESEVIDIEEILNIEEIGQLRDQDLPRWEHNHLNILADNYRPFITNCYFNPLKIYYKKFTLRYWFILKFYYHSPCYTSNIYTIKLWDKLCCAFACNMIFLVMAITVGIFIGRTVSWLIFPWGAYWVDFAFFVLIGLLGCLMIVIALILLSIVGLIITSIGECMCVWCFT